MWICRIQSTYGFSNSHAHQEMTFGCLFHLLLYTSSFCQEWKV